MVFGFQVMVVNEHIIKDLKKKWSNEQVTCRTHAAVILSNLAYFGSWSNLWH